MKYLLIVLIAIVAAFGLMIHQNNVNKAKYHAQEQAYNAARDAKNQAMATRTANLNARFEKQQQQWGKKSPEQLANEAAQKEAQAAEFRKNHKDVKVVTQQSADSVAMDFSECTSKLQGSMLAVAGHYKTDLIVNTSDMVMGRICTNDGSVLVTCSRPDSSMITKKSDSTGCD